MIELVQVNQFQLPFQSEASPYFISINEPPSISSKSLTMSINRYFPIFGPFTFINSISLVNIIMANTNCINLNLISIYFPPFGVNFNQFLLFPLNILFHIIALHFSLYFSPFFLLNFSPQKLHHVAIIFYSSCLFTQYFPQFFFLSIPYVFLNLFLQFIYFSFHFHFYRLILYLFYNGIWFIQSMDLETDHTCSFCIGWIVARISIHSIHLFSPNLSSVCMNYLNLKSNND